MNKEYTHSYCYWNSPGRISSLAENRSEGGPLEPLRCCPRINECYIASVTLYPQLLLKEGEKCFGVELVLLWREIVQTNNRHQEGGVETPIEREQLIVHDVGANENFRCAEGGRAEFGELEGKGLRVWNCNICSEIEGRHPTLIIPAWFRVLRLSVMEQRSRLLGKFC